MGGVGDSGGAGSGAGLVWAADTTAMLLTGRGDTVRALPLRFTGRGRPGTHKGPVRVAPDTAGVVSLSVRVTHGLFWPVVAVLLGVLASSWLPLYVGVRRAIWRLRQRAARVAEEADGLPVYAGYSIGADLKRQLARMEAAVERLRSGHQLRL